MPEPNHAQHHREHFSRHRHRDEEQARELAEGVVDEDLAYGAAGGESEHGVADGGVAPDEGRRGGEFVGGAGGEADEWGEGGG